MSPTHRRQIDADLYRCLRSFPSRPAKTVDSLRPGFWARAWESGVAVPVAHQLGALAQLGNGHRLQAAYGIRSLATLREAAQVLTEAGVPAVPLKGPLLGARLYPEYTWRPTSDVDLLVKAADLDRAIDALIARGGQLDAPYVENRAAHERFNHHLGVSFRGGLVEVHMRASNHFGSPLPSEPLLERSHEAEVLGIRTRRLDPTDELLFLAVHAASHLWLRDILLLDLRLLAEHEPIDWERLARQSQELRLGRVVTCTLEVARQRVGLEVPPLAWPASALTDRLRRLSSEVGVLVAEDLLGALRIVAAEVLWVETPALALRFVGDRIAFGVGRRLRSRWSATFG